MIYRIGTIPPSRGALVEDLLVSHRVTYLYPKQLVEVRVGRQRIRELRPRPIFPGLVFVDDVLADEVVGILSSRGLSIWWLRDHLANDAPARCTDEEVAPLLAWIDQQNSLASEPPVQAELPLVVEFQPSTLVMISAGPFQGFLATVIKDDGKVAQVDLATGRFSMQIASCHLRLPDI